MKYIDKYPDKQGRFGRFGGRFAPETLIPALEELEECFDKIYKKREFKDELSHHLYEFGGRPTPLYFAEGLSEMMNAKIYIKREDLVHGGAHKLNNALGQALLAKKMGKERLIAETGAGQHGIATAIVAAKFGFKCDIYMGKKDMERQKLNVFRMNLMGAKVHPVKSGSMTLKDAINEAMRDWIANVETTHYLIGSVVGPHPYPLIVREFQRVIGQETKKQILTIEKRLPDSVIACTGGGSNSIGIFYDFLDDDVVLYAVEAGGEGLETAKHSATLCTGVEGVLHGAYSYLLQDEYGRIKQSHSISAGLDYPGVGPELAFLKEEGRINAVSVTDAEALEAFEILCRSEGILPALESAHALAHALKLNDDLMVINLSGRGDKDVETVARTMGVKI